MLCGYGGGLWGFQLRSIFWAFYCFLKIEKVVVVGFVVTKLFMKIRSREASPKVVCHLFFLFVVGVSLYRKLKMIETHFAAKYLIVKI